jgi:single-strand DNA-binding protein
MQTRSWEQNGEKKYRTEVIADTVQFGPRSAGGGGSSRSQSHDMDDAPSNAGPGIDYPKDDINPDDIPF